MTLIRSFGFARAAIALLSAAAITAACGDISIDASSKESSGNYYSNTDAGGSSPWQGPGSASDAGSSQQPGPAPGCVGEECESNCLGKQCGPDGAGGTCGWCGGGDSCQTGVCVTVDGCTPDCAGQMIGVEDGCGGVCSGDGFGIGLVPGGAQDAAYFRMLVNSGTIPESELLPIEGWLTEHGTALPPPETDRFVTMHGFVGLFFDPEQGEPTVALQLGMNSAVPPDVIEEGRFNLCAVVDKSGSMNAEDKMHFVREGLVQMLDSLDEDDYLSIVTYSTAAEVLMPPTKVSDRAAIEDLIRSITAGGSTNIHAGLELGYEQVLKNIADKGATPRVVLLSDGVATEGITATAPILAMSGSYNDAGVGVTTIGAGVDFNFELMHGLATQGLGNFYFIDSADKLAQVFQEEIKYLLTPVANNLKVWFTLPDGFGVDDIYGFDYSFADGQATLLGPSPQYTVSGGEVVDQPPTNPGEEPEVAVSTLFASKKNGLLMVKINAPDANLLKAQENAALSTIHYSYDLVDSDETEAFEEEFSVGSLEYDDADGFQYFSGATMQRNFCLLRMALAMREAVELYHQAPEDNVDAAIKQLAWSRTFCEGINVQMQDPKITEDVALVTQLMENICDEQACAE